MTRGEKKCVSVSTGKEKPAELPRAIRVRISSLNRVGINQRLAVISSSSDCHNFILLKQTRQWQLVMKSSSTRTTVSNDFGVSWVNKKTELLKIILEILSSSGDDQSVLDGLWEQRWLDSWMVVIFAFSRSLFKAIQLLLDPSRLNL